jgi:hypothetical protein
MNDTNYPQDELELKHKIDEFNERWRKCLVKQIPELDEPQNDLFVPDGFFPYYTHQKIKILFLARESRNIGGINYIDILYDAYKENRISGKSINVMSNKFHSLQMYLTYAALHNDIMQYSDPKLPYASEIAKSFATNDGPSFAFMDLSKLSSESDVYSANWAQIDKFVEYSSNETSKKYSPNFFAEELSLLKPDIIIGMNLSNKYDLFGKRSYIKEFGKENQVCAYTLETTMGDKYFLLDSFHFSAPSKDINDDYMVPIMSGIKYYKEKCVNSSSK